MKFVYQHLFLSGVNSCKRGNLDMLIRSDRFLLANSNKMCRCFRVEWASSSVVVGLPTWGMPKMISRGNLACRPNKKNGVSCMVVLKDVL